MDTTAAAVTSVLTPLSACVPVYVCSEPGCPCDTKAIVSKGRQHAADHLGAGDGKGGDAFSVTSFLWRIADVHLRRRAVTRMND